MGELLKILFKYVQGGLKCIKLVDCLGFFYPVAFFLESPENFSDSRFARGIREICENRSVLPRHFLTILAGFILFNRIRANFCA